MNEFEKELDKHRSSDAHYVNRDYELHGMHSAEYVARLEAALREAVTMLQEQFDEKQADAMYPLEFSTPECILSALRGEKGNK